MIYSAFSQQVIIPRLTVTVNTNGSSNIAYFLVGAIELLLPTTKSNGSILWAISISGGARITQSAGDQIVMPAGATTTLGAAGYLEFDDTYSSVQLVYYEDGDIWVVENVSGIVDAL